MVNSALPETFHLQKEKILIYSNNFLEMVRAKKGYKRKMRKKTKSNTSDKKKLLASRHLSKNKVKNLKKKNIYDLGR